MYKKRCGECDKISYSLSRTGSWICTGCGSDIGDMPIIPFDRSTADVLPLKGMSGPLGSRN